jgi:two-component system, OmpR family, response regulator RegX3
MRIAIIEHDSTIAAELADSLSNDGHSCQSYGAAGEFLQSLSLQRFDACIVDHQFPGLDDRHLLRRIRELDPPVPVLVLTVRGAEMEAASALDNGNNDFQVKPLHINEFRARLTALVRRGVPPAPGQVLFAYDRFEFNLKTRVVTASSIPVTMTQKEFQLALLLLGNIGKALSRSDIREAVWGRNCDVPSRTLDTHVSRVRTKLGLRPSGGYLLAPLYSFGYRLENLKLH